MVHRFRLNFMLFSTTVARFGLPPLPSNGRSSLIQIPIQRRTWSGSMLWLWTPFSIRRWFLANSVAALFSRIDFRSISKPAAKGTSATPSRGSEDHLVLAQFPAGPWGHCIQRTYAHKLVFHNRHE